jgi:adenylate kinase
MSRTRAALTHLGKLRVVLLGPPGGGKGTQGERLAAIYAVPHLSAGEILRSEVSRRTPLGTRIVGALESGELVDDSVVIPVILDKIGDGSKGFVLDGFPRTRVQAGAVDEWALSVGRPLQAAVELRVPHGELVTRLERRAGQASRSDDTQGVIRHRLHGYREGIKEVLAYYSQVGILITVDGSGAVDAVTSRLRIQIDQVLADSELPDAPANRLDGSVSKGSSGS